MEGLTAQEAELRLKKDGPNVFKEKKQFIFLKTWLKQFESPLVYVLLVAGLVTVFLKDYSDSLVIFSAVFINGFLGYYQERKAQKSLDKLRQFLSPKAKVIRDGMVQIIDLQNTVVGDLVILEIGSRVPADGLLVEGTNLTFNEAILTGESMPVNKFKIKNLKLKINEGNRVYMGTTVATGIGKMLVTKIGSETEIGKIGRSITTIEEEATPLQKQLTKLIKNFTLLVALLVILIFIGGELRGYLPLEMFTLSIAIAVAAVPEGLTVSMTVVLALGMQRILKQKAIVRRLIAAETLGSVSVICADKTGTLTTGILKVAKSDFMNQDLGLKAAVLCNDFRDPLEEAMFQYANEQLGEQTVKKIRIDFPRLAEIPFSPQTKLIYTLHPGLLLVSGAPEVLLRKCKIQNAKSKIWEQKFEEYGKQGYRIVGFAYKKSRNLDPKGLEWLGVLVFEDPVKEGVKEVLADFQKAGIKIKIITGDYLETALATLKKLGLKITKAQCSISGDVGQVDQTILFARTNPDQKLKIVEALKNNGEVVAMIGDGVNDAPALVRADIGIVVEKSADVSQEIADMVLTSRDLGSVLSAIKEGRQIYENMKKIIFFLFTNSFSEIILIGGSIILGLPLPVTAAQILWVNLIEGSLPGIALAFEPEEKGLLLELPRSKKTPILNQQMKTLILIISLISSSFLLYLFSRFKSPTLIFSLLTVDTLFMVYACRSWRNSVWQINFFTNRNLNLSVLIGLIMLLAAIYLPSLQKILHTQPLPLNQWLMLIGFGIFNLLIVEISKQLVLSKNA